MGSLYIEAQGYVPVLLDHLHGWPLFIEGASGTELASQCRRQKRHRFDPWVGKVPWRRAWQATPVFLPGEWTEEPGGPYSPQGCKESEMAKGIAHTICQAPLY